MSFSELLFPGTEYFAPFQEPFSDHKIHDFTLKLSKILRGDTPEPPRRDRTTLFRTPLARPTCALKIILLTYLLAYLLNCLLTSSPQLYQNPGHWHVVEFDYG